MGAVGIGVTCMGAVGIMGAPSMGLETIGAVGTLMPPCWSEGAVSCGAMGGDDNVDMGVSPVSVPPPVAVLVVLLVVVLAAAFVFWRPCLRMMR